MTRDAARFTSLMLIVALFAGTLLPGSWKDAALQPLPTSIHPAALAHIVLFAGICFTVPPAQFWRVRSWHVLVLGLVLALLTEGLQFFAIDRQPNVDGVAQDLIGALMGWALGRFRSG
jgi:VanZ family protein